MFYCEKCKIANKENFCIKCGKSNLPTIKDDDLCLFAVLYKTKSDAFENDLKANGIFCISLPCGFDEMTRANLNKKIFIFYKDREICKEILNNAIKF